MASPWCSPGRGIFGIRAVRRAMCPWNRDGRDKPGHDDMGHTRSALNHTEAVIHCSSFCFGWAPTWREASWPPLNSIKVGIDMMPYFAAVPGFSSTLSLTILTLPLSDLEISSRAGEIIRHGPHHSAQKSTTTGPLAFSTSVSNVASVTLSTIGKPHLFRQNLFGRAGR